MTGNSPTFEKMKSIGGPGKNSRNLFEEIHKHWGHLPINQGLNNIEQGSQTLATTGTPLENARKEAEIIATDVVLNFGSETEKKSPDRYCKTMRKRVREISDRHDIALKSMVNKLNLGDNNMFCTFVNVADEIFEDGQINWGRVVVVYAFAARLVSHLRKNSEEHVEKVALYVGKYVANKLGRWIMDNGGWDAFADFFSDENAVEDKVWRGLLFTATLGGLGALAAVMAR